MNRENEWIPAPDQAHRCDQSNGKKQEQKQKQNKSRTVISVREMGDLLGLKKTERYWLVHKNYFETKTAIGKMWVDIASFENWYANQLKYKKVTGEEPGQKIREWTYSAKDISQMLGIVEAGAYDLIKRESIETVIIDDRIRVPKKAFHEWYAGQSHYRTQEDRQADAKIEESTLSLPQVAALLGVPRNTVYSILRDQKESQRRVLPLSSKGKIITDCAQTQMTDLLMSDLLITDPLVTGLQETNLPGKETKWLSRMKRVQTRIFHVGIGRTHSCLLYFLTWRICNLRRQQALEKTVPKKGRTSIFPLRTLLLGHSCPGRQSPDMQKKDALNSAGLGERSGSPATDLSDGLRRGKRS